MLPKRVSRLDLWKYYSLYGGMWNLFCRVGHYPYIQNSSVVYSKEEPALQCRRQYYAPDSLLLKAWFRGYCGSPGLGGPRTAGLYPLAGLLDYEHTRLKTSARVRMGLSFAWKTSLPIRILCFLPCNRFHVNPSSLVSI